MSIRDAALAGMWYPGTETACRRKIEGLIEGTAPSKTGIAGIVPHAGWDYSGSLAIKVYQALAAAAVAPELILLFGTHMAPSSRPHISRASGFETPLGAIDAAEGLTEELAKRLKLSADPADSRFRGGGDNTIEVQLPMIKYFMPDAKLAVISPPFSSESIEIGRVAVEAAKELEVPFAVVGSTDLTHYGPRFGFTPKGVGETAARWVREENDAQLIQKVLDMDPEAVLDEAAENHNACVPGAVAAALAGAKEMGATEASLLEYRSSYDLGPSDTFVGYAAIVME